MIFFINFECGAPVLFFIDISYTVNFLKRKEVKERDLPLAALGLM